ncbi:uncharacterized protein F4822DRAFT_236686 [Hypoxylon trugodes]|uniref:uncharacterized protein n=1 Tax=Hypoxylon trugodes TaxID=326681 RepID=UPI00219277BC|nr:uncharacterized protein F4822DRAFT_236686 [Hypoxylon trugodes]KAI1388173.1 hypothetical protein F4822DRAFT_236686 [Hypoxylon trugodes]
MTTTVIDNTDPEKIPRSAIDILRDVVQLRKRSARFFSSAAANSDNDALKQKTSAHDHIIQVLEGILHRFEAAISKIRPSTSTPSTSSDNRLDMKDIKNIFEYLKPEDSQIGDEGDLNEDSDTAAPVPKRKTKTPKKNGKKSKSKKPPKSQPTQKRKTGSQGTSWVDNFQWLEGEEEDDDEYDYYMLIYCFFQDFNSIRTFVIDRWTEYFYHKSVALDTLAVVTNAACEMFHEMEAELKRTLKDVPEMADYDFMLDTLFFEYGLDHVDYSDEDKLTDRERNHKIFGEADWLAFPAYTQITQMLEFIPPGKVPMVPTEAIIQPKYGVHEYEGYREFMKNVMFEIMPECCLIKAMKANGLLPMIVSAQDEFTLDFEDILRVRGYSTGAIFGLAIYLDIRYILEDQVDHAFRLLETTGAQMKATLQEHLPNIRSP